MVTVVIVVCASLTDTVINESVLLLKQIVPLLSHGCGVVSLLLQEIESTRQVKRMAREIVFIGNLFVSQR
jgi:hypothetical protein